MNDTDFRPLDQRQWMHAGVAAAAPAAFDHPIAIRTEDLAALARVQQMFSALGVFVNVLGGTVDAAYAVEFVVHEDLMMWRASLATGCIYECAPHAVWRFAEPGLALALIPRGSRLRIQVLGGRAHQTITLLVRVKQLAQQFGLSRSEIRVAAAGSNGWDVDASRLLAARPLTPEVAAR